MGDSLQLLYLCDTHIPSRATSGMQIMRMCAAFQKAGAAVTLVRPYRFGNRPEGYDGDLWRFYGVSPRFDTATLPTPQTLRVAQIKWLSRIIRIGPLAAFVLSRTWPGRPPFVAYSRSMLATSLGVLARRVWGRRSACRAVFVELHDFPRSRRLLRTLEKVDGVVAISDALRAKLVSELPSLGGRVWVEHDGADTSALPADVLGGGQRAARSRLNLRDTSGPFVVYTGRAIAGKGVDVLLDAVPHLEAINAHVVIVGKVYEDEYIERAAKLAGVTFVGFRPPADVAGYLIAADILVLPTTPDLPYARYTSPLKLFEYMASGRPIVASNLPVFQEVLRDGVNALLYAPRDAAALADAVKRLWRDDALRRTLADNAWNDVQRFSWDRRAERILRRIETTIGA